MSAFRRDLFRQTFISQNILSAEISPRNGVSTARGATSCSATELPPKKQDKKLFKLPYQQFSFMATSNVLTYVCSQNIFCYSNYVVEIVFVLNFLFYENQLLRSLTLVGIFHLKMLLFCIFLS